LESRRLPSPCGVHASRSRPCGQPHALRLERTRERFQRRARPYRPWRRSRSRAWDPSRQSRGVSSAPETERLHPHPGTGVLGFNWAIDPASPDAVHEAQSGLERKPPRVDHDALEDILIDQKTVYRFFSKGTWKLLDMP